VVITLAIVVRVSRRSTHGASDFYTAGGGFSGQQNGIAISGDYLSAASFLGIAGPLELVSHLLSFVDRARNPGYQPAWPMVE